MLCITEVVPMFIYITVIYTILLTLYIYKAL